MLKALAETFEHVRAGASTERAEERVEELSGLLSRRGACAHPDGTVRFATSALEVFAEELADHARHGPCEACARPPEMPLPTTHALRR